MFYNCRNLQTIIIGKNWSTESVTTSSSMFTNCTSLVGGMGTVYDASHVDAAYAHYDGGTSYPGYLTVRPTGYACYTSNNTTLTFYYDDQCPLRAATAGTTTYDLNEESNDPEWFTDSTFVSVTNVVFDPSFMNARPTTLYRWFYKFSSLQNISNMEHLNTEAVTNMNGLFQGCSSLTSIDVSSFITAKVTSMSNMFRGCNRLTSLDVSNLNTAKVTDISNMFYGCSGLTSLDVTNFNTANVKLMNGMFSSCSGLTSIDLSSFNTANVTNMSGMFTSCRGLTSLDVTNFNTANVSSMSSMFANCSGLTSIDLTNFNTVNVSNMSGMFRDCSGLTSLDVSSFNTESAQEFTYMFSGCSGLTRLDLSLFNTAKVRNMNYMFYGCGNLTRIYAGINWNTDAVTSSNYMFADCTKLAGGKGTPYNSGHLDATYAHVDGGSSNPGYLTVGISAYAFLYNNILYFYYDTSWNSLPSAGTVYALNTGTNRPGWYDNPMRGLRAPSCGSMV